MLEEPESDKEVILNTVEDERFPRNMQLTALHTRDSAYVSIEFLSNMLTLVLMKFNTVRHLFPMSVTTVQFLCVMCSPVLTQAHNVS